MLSQLSTLREYAASLRSEQERFADDMELGIQIEFRCPPDIDLVIESLDRAKQGIELLNVQRDEKGTRATVFVPDGKLNVFEKLLLDYMEQDTKPSKTYPSGRPKNQDLVETIQEIRASALESLWTDNPEVMPQRDDEAIWWEVWLTPRRNRAVTLQRFCTLVETIGFIVAPGALHFLERIVLLMHGSKQQIKDSMMLLNSVAELRRAKETAEFFDDLPQHEQGEWVDELLSRTHYSTDGDMPCVCILDTGVNRGHPLLAPALNPADLHTIHPSWGAADDDGHGTEMAGLALFGDLTAAMDTNAMIHISHGLESVKLLRYSGDRAMQNHGHLTVEAVARPEIRAPGRRRLFSMAVTAKDNRDRGRPSAWSAAIDQLASDSQNDGPIPRLMVVSAGNVLDHYLEYPNNNTIDSIHDPGQAWNALTVGAYTEKTTIAGKDTSGYSPLVPWGALSPFSTTSMIWEKPWPLKPDVVFEGGNLAKDPTGTYTMSSLSLLTTAHLFNQRLLTISWATSAATALCARMAAQLMAHHPHLWPETIRALIVHSAAWTDSMRQMFMTGNTLKEQCRRLIRHCGFGVPSLQRAMWSTSNSLTLIAQDELQPFEKNERGNISARDMNYYKLPWPTSALEQLGATEVEMRVTISYFIEPNPTRREFKKRYTYESHGLRFQVRRPTEGESAFRYRINKLARDEEEGVASTDTDPDPGWMLGTQLRHLGSLHADIWRGTAADLAQLGVIAVYPASGWWKTRMSQKRYHNKARYALIVSIRAPEVEVDLYSIIQEQLVTETEITT
ncbi:MAG: S8 family peptidase [Magnetococcus sp. YQC-3]